MNHTNCFHRFFDRLFLRQKFCAGLLRFFFFCHANEKLAPKQRTKIVYENIANYICM